MVTVRALLFMVCTETENFHSPKMMHLTLLLQGVCEGGSSQSTLLSTYTVSFWRWGPGQDLDRRIRNKLVLGSSCVSVPIFRVDSAYKYHITESIVYLPVPC